MGKCTVWDIITAYNKYDGSPTAHKDVVNTLKKHDHHTTMSDAWCSQTVMAALYDANGIDTIGYGASASAITSRAKSLGIWHNGTNGVRPGDILIYCDSKKRPNHTEFCIGYNRTISGNYNGGCSRRTYKGRSVLGYARPKYNAMPAMNDLQVTICAAEVILGTYGSGDNRIKMLAAFGEINAKQIQAKVNEIVLSSNKTIQALAVAAIAGYMGKNTYRTKRLSTWSNKVQTRINEIYALRGKSVQAAAQCVIDGKFGTGYIRVLLLKFCGYNAAAVQAKVNDIIKKKQQGGDSSVTTGHRIRIHQIWVSESKESLYGDSYLICEYGDDDKTIIHSVLIDTGPGAGDTLKKIKKINPSKIDAIFFSHGHGDHVSASSLRTLCNTYKVQNIFISDYKEMEGVSAAKNAINTLKTAGSIAKSKGINYKYISTGFTWSAGNIKLEWTWQAKRKQLKQSDDHHFVNMMSIALMFNLNGWKFFTAGDLSYEAIDALVKDKGSALKCDVFKLQWHSDRNGIKIVQIKAAKPKVGLSNYHHGKSSGGRKSTYKVFTDVGTIVMMAYENGDCYVDCWTSTMKISCSKGNLSKTFNK